jgi:hypothetical protein
MVSLAGRRWGPQVAGWLAGLPVVAGPILFFLAVERGAGFAATASTLSLSAVLASVSFSLAFAHAGRRGAWWPALLAGLAAWALAATALARGRWHCRWPPCGWHRGSFRPSRLNPRAARWAAANCCCAWPPAPG